MAVGPKPVRPGMLALHTALGSLLGLRVLHPAAQAPNTLRAWRRGLSCLSCRLFRDTPHSTDPYRTGAAARVGCSGSHLFGRRGKPHAAVELPARHGGERLGGACLGTKAEGRGPRGE